MAENWFALRVKPRHERLVATALHGKGYEEFLPLYRCRRKWSDRVKVLDLPLFPGYVFCRFDPNDRLPILTTPGVLLIVSSGKTPLPVDENEISAVRTIVESQLQVEPWPYLAAGHLVCVISGPLRGIEGFFLNCKRPGRLVVSVTILQRSVAVEMDSECVVPLGAGYLSPYFSARALQQP